MAAPENLWCFDTRYTRSDLYTAALERIAELEAERDGYRSAAHKMHDAFVGSGMAGAFNQDRRSGCI